MNPSEHLNDGEENSNTPATTETAAADVYDLDGDGKVSMVESLRAHLGVVDARLEQIAQKGGPAGRVADALHHAVDAVDND